MLIAIINEEGKVVDAKELLPNGETREIEYEKDEKKSIRSAMLYTPNGCCWKKIGGVWKCVPC